MLVSMLLLNIFVCWFLALACDKVIDAISTTYKSNGEHDASNDAVDITQGAKAKVIAHLIDDPSNEQPPADGTTYERAETYKIKPPGFIVCSKKEIRAREKCNIKENNEWVTYRNAKAREEILEDT